MRQRQKGFTLLEVVVAVGIVGAIVTTAGMTVTTLLMNFERPTNQQPLLQQVQNAGHWMTRDIKMTSNVTPSAPNGFPLTLNIPVDSDPNHDYYIIYLFDGNKLKRQLYDSLDNLIAETFIAQYVDADNTTFANIGTSLYKLTIRASLGKEAVTTSYEMCQRLTQD